MVLQGFERTKYALLPQFIVVALVDTLAVFAFVVLVSDFIRKTFYIKSINIYLISIFLFFVFKYIMNIIKYRNVVFKPVFPFTSFPLLVAYICLFYERSFGEFNIGAIIFHLKFGVEGFSAEYYVLRMLKYVSIATLLILTISYLAGRNSLFSKMDKLLAIPILISTPLVLNTFGYILHASDADALVAEYRQPQIVGAKGKTKNLLLIYVESGERTFSEVGGGAAAFADMNAIAASGLDVHGIRQVENTGWSMAGIVASQCGVPLQPAGLLRANKIGRLERFLPNLTCLGDLLTERGYALTHMIGASLAFGGEDKFLSQHGYGELIDQDELQGWAGGSLNDWGLYDDALLSAAEEKLQVLAKQDKPYVLSLMTIGGHFPEGYPSKDCADEFGAQYADRMLLAVKCTGLELRKFIESARSKNLLENTVVVLMSDHLAMKNALSRQLDQHDRMNYFVALGGEAGRGVRVKAAATFDIYPTLLELLGFELRDRRAGLGVSLLSDDADLMEKHGKDTLDTMIRYGYGLGRMMWGSG